ncbi:MAG: DNA mismatch repair protein MutS [Microcystis aeruginosa Ma_QC_Ch_20071001_S25]|jgi:DNA mismatch repair protein MutS|uniref:DNA mismatch repair protein MutS n=1 Tax=Microcystis aeruginosa Ma_QC_Ch_20071001_S25D TaxID=2486250 RepID=A0A552FDE4_MICAE|nr:MULTISPECIES: DNA mismatch repair protein MutS [unclassified Microcystis]MCA2764492.1 DNA mismatch repair protein MutS [Microcystis sp. M151S2]TRU44723.1 MAG: DNA mismatch repair protein MutS [Microcystis aeruginosa Ma_QC_Ch_20071001_S25D]TRU46610.1 MAG: DNA mismatch repair protein MutS [Microcystis aeruginosa Ma_QC_Ch_20071001_S25]TRU66549.1 MAG: DNA mismatch repair protein MutS [Microcystis aeruginosa Ma_QC_Ch_20071001_M135]MCA2642857.1 DNA mismatch repair protein MutS [Microcystis sp. M0
MTLPSDFPLEPPATNKDPHRDYRGLDRSKLTPMYQHYVEVKETYPNALLLYRVGDFFECFFQDAVIISRELELVLTSKEGGKGIGRVAMTGVPHHALERYSRLLVEKGYAVAICDQVEDSTEAAAEKRLVERAITKLLTPGTLTDEGMLNAKKNNFLAAVVITGENWGLAYADISTGEFYTTQASDLTALSLELTRLQPSEILFPINAPDLNRILRPGEKSDHLPPCLPDSFCYSLRPQTIFTLTEAKNRLLITYKMRSLEGMGCEHLPLAIRAAGGLLEYIEDTQKANQVPLQPLKTYSISEFLILDGQTRRNLEITQTVRDGSFYGSLLWAIDRTCTAMGSRALRRWLLQPLLDSRGIRARQDTIQELKDNPSLRQDIRQKLREIYDIERLSGRVGAGTANARDLLSLAASLVKLADLAALVALGNSPYLKALQQIPADLEKLGQQVIAHLVESPPLHLKEGGVIREGIDAQLDALRRDYQEVIDWFKNLETTEKERTGISNLKVNYNKTFGYYISLPRSKADFAPKDYVRKQTLVNEERYITTELKEKENIILTAVDELNKLEYEIFSDLRRQVSEFSPEIREVATKVAALDVLAGLAEIAVYQGYCRPEIADGRLIDIKDGRHPVVEQSLGAGFFVPNSINLGNQEGLEYPDLIILTGPNASGKSCYLRQVGLIQLLAQTGSFVPAKSAKISICDRIFTRVGAVDDLATGQSTFMVEMNETANILNHATERSLVLLDEIGRGTATFDGLSIAWSVAEYLATVLQSRTIFATHYHELNELASILENVANYQVTVKELPHEIVFLHQVRPGGADKSYGIEAGRLAGLPASVIDRAMQVMGQIEKHSKIAIGLRQGIKKIKPVKSDNSPSLQQLDIFDDSK